MYFGIAQLNSADLQDEDEHTIQSIEYTTTMAIMYYIPDGCSLLISSTTTTAATITAATTTNHCYY